MKVSLHDLVELHPVTKDALVVDIGGYKGDYADTVLKLWGCNIIIYEPEPTFYTLCKERFKNDDRVTTIDVAITNEENPKLYINNDGSTLYRKWCEKNGKQNPESINVRGKKASDEFKTLHIDVLKLNCEGSEFDIIKDLYTNNLLDKIPYVIVQFHKVPNLIHQYTECQDILLDSHKRIFNFKWQIWKKK